MLFWHTYLTMWFEKIVIQLLEQYFYIYYTECNLIAFKMNFSTKLTTELKNASLKVTPARLGVLSALEKTKKPLDVTSIFQYLQKQEIKADKVTVFRIVSTLTEKGILTPIQFGDGKLRYEHTTKADHHHFVCEKCGSITDISDCTIGDLEKDIKKRKGLLIKRHSLEFFGLCADCQK